MKQLDLFDTTIDSEIDLTMSDNQEPTTEALLSIEQLEALPVYQPNVIVKAVKAMFFEHKKEGRDGFACAIAQEWIV